MLKKVMHILDNPSWESTMTEGGNLTRVDVMTTAKRIISAVADDIEKITPKMPRIPMDNSDHYPFAYLEGAQGEHTYIVEYLRGLLKEER